MKKSKRKQTPANKKYWLSASIFGVLILGTVLFLSQAQQQQQAISKAAGGDCTVSDADMQEHPDEQKFLKLANDYRAKNGVGPLKLSHEAKKPAQWYANELAKNYVHDNHADSFGRKAMQRFNDCGMDVSAVAENKSPDSKSAEEVLARWTDDEGHKKNVLSDREFLGLGRKNDVWVAVFASGVKVKGQTENAVPSPNCLGGCPTASVSASPVISSPAASPAVSAAPLVTVPTNSTPNTDGPLGILLLFFQLILKLFQGGI